MHYTAYYLSTPLHQVQTPAYFPANTTRTHGYAGHHVVPPGDAMVDPEEHLGASFSAYVALAPAAPPPLAVAPVSDDDRFAVLEKALRLVQGKDHQSYQFRDLCLFPKAALP